MLEYLEPHSICLSVEPLLILLLVLFNAGIALSYFVIPFAMLRYFRIGRPPTLVYLFAVFTLGCGGTHVMQVATMYIGGFDYWLETFVCGITFVASVGTAIVLTTQGPQIQEWLKSAVASK
jgi:hypothetical protein